MGRPIASAAVQPNIRSAAGFHEVMIPSRVLLTIASSEESTMAASRARVSSKRRRSLMSRAIFEAPTTRPVESLTGETVSDTSTRRPSFVTRTVSKCSTRSPRRTLARTVSSSSARRSSGMMSVIGWPTASAAVQPNNRSAAGFHEVMIPSRVLLTITSLDESTMAASRAAASARPGPAAGGVGRERASVIGHYDSRARGASHSGGFPARDATL